MITPILFIIGFIGCGLLSFSFFYKMMEIKEERTFQNFLYFIGSSVGFVCIIIVNKSLYNLVFETVI